MRVVFLTISGVIIALLLILISRTFLVVERNEYVSVEDDELFWNMFRVLRCESRFNNNAKGEHGELGMAQFLPNTFYSFAEKYDLNLDITNERDQIRLMMLMFKNGYSNLWSCYNQLKTKN